MRRFFCSPENITSQQIQILDSDELHHLRDVLCLKHKESVAVIDGKGREFICQISHLGKDCAKLNIIKKHILKKEDLSLRLTIACAMPKRSKMDFIVEKLTEIGVEKIIFLKTERTQVSLKDCSKKIGRLKNVAASALKQSGNLFLPEIDFLKFGELLKFKSQTNFDLAIIPNLFTNTQCLKDILTKVSGKKILVAIGPEGDFSEKEIKLAKQSGFISVSLGDTVLKVDTAAIVTAGFVRLSV